MNPVSRFTVLVLGLFIAFPIQALEWKPRFRLPPASVGEEYTACLSFHLLDKTKEPVFYEILDLPKWAKIDRGCIVGTPTYYDYGGTRIELIATQSDKTAAVKIYLFVFDDK